MNLPQRGMRIYWEVDLCSGSSIVPLWAASLEVAKLRGAGYIILELSPEVL